MSHPDSKSKKNEIQSRLVALAATFEFIERFIPFRGRKVLEIGCDRQFASAIEISLMGAASIDCVNIYPINTARIDDIPTIKFHKTDAGTLPFENESFDIAYGRAVLEHIHKPEAIAEELVRVLKPGGMFYLDGGPMWTCRHGHHVWVNSTEGIDYIFPNHNVFEPWEHLMYSTEELQKRLTQRGIPENHVNLIIQHVFFSNDQSRLAPTTIIDSFLRLTRLETLPIRVAVGPPPPTIGNYSELDLRTGKLILIGIKPGKDYRSGSFSRYVNSGLDFFNERFIA